MDLLNTNTYTSAFYTIGDVTYNMGANVGYGLIGGINYTAQFGYDIGSGVGSMVGISYSPVQTDDSDNEYCHVKIDKKEYVKKGKTITYTGDRSSQLSSNNNLQAQAQGNK